jgi:hypothetical protein
MQRVTRKRAVEPTANATTAVQIAAVTTAGPVQQPPTVDSLQGLASPHELAGALKAKVQNRSVSKGV